MREGFITSVTKLYYESRAEQQPKQEKPELAGPRSSMSGAGICLGMDPGSRAYTSSPEMNCVVWHHFILHWELWLKVKGKIRFMSVAVIAALFWRQPLLLYQRQPGKHARLQRKTIMGCASANGDVSTAGTQRSPSAALYSQKIN